jgi:hypothetical protein
LIPTTDDGDPHVTQQDLLALFAFVRDCLKDETYIMRALLQSGQAPP